MAVSPPLVRFDSKVRVVLYGRDMEIWPFCISFTYIYVLQRYGIFAIFISFTYKYVSKRYGIQAIGISYTCE